MNKSQNFFADNYLKFAKYMFDQGESNINSMLLDEKKHRDNLLNEISSVMMHYKIKDNVMDMSDSEQNKEKIRLDKVIAASFKKQYEEEDKEIISRLNNVSKDKYNSNNYILSLGTEAKGKNLMIDKMKSIVNNGIDGENYHKRLWNNKNKSAQAIQKEVKKFIQGKTNVNEIEAVIKKKYNTNASNTQRLVRTELARVQSQTNEKWVKDNGIEWQLFSAVLDKSTSKICRSYEDKIYKVDDDNKPIPPLHPYCRSALIPVTKDEYRPNLLESDVNWKSYEKWEGEIEKQDSSVIINNKKFDFKPAKTIEEAEEYAMKTLGIPKACYKNLDIVTANAWNEGLKDSFDRFPVLKNNFGFVGESHARNKLIKLYATEKYLNKYIKASPIMSVDVLKIQAEKEAEKLMKKVKIYKNDYAQILTSKLEELEVFRGITVNGLFGIDSEYFLEFLNYDVKIKFHPVGCDTIRSLLDHEIGHQLDDLLKISRNKEIRYLYDSRKITEKTNDLSRYSWKNTNHNRYSEFVAEGWSEYCNNPKPRPVAKKIGEIIERMYKEWEKKNL